MSRVLRLLHGLAFGIHPASNFFTAGQRFQFENFGQLKDLTDLLANGAIATNAWAGGSRQSTDTLSGAATGNFEVRNARRIEIDNTDLQLSSFADSYGAAYLVRFRYVIRVSNAAISVTPKIYNETSSAYATVTGALACNATNTDFSGTNQKQSIYLTLATGVKQYVPHFEITGTPSGGYTVLVDVTLDRFVSL